MKKSYRIIPALDLIEGQCVRLTEGDYQTKKVYSEDPLAVAQEFEALGLEYLHLVDLDGAKAGKIVNWQVLEKICQHTQLKVDFGGGLKTSEDLKIAFEAGASQVTIGSVAVQKPDLFCEWLENYGPQSIILGADVREGKIAVSGWQMLTSIDLLDFLEAYQQKGIQYVICTDISKDGRLAGPAFSLYATLKSRFPALHIIASGGVSQVEDVIRLGQIGLEGVIIGKALYEGRITYAQLQALIS
ncbi:MAG: 1-(5-phosphoribosyl)-5-[(5-phosphoribosylamino)methylideneamino]imidazole-4-carboxamide isomerase [Microscillaceae bacterium]|nr:1-(5-phosphoribosyl)-5-[(5-phosphoribosylamino)methylideneamino]imidazole-4-carboxamide isomerase [Microscillaceae bacterium]